MSDFRRKNTENSVSDAEIDLFFGFLTSVGVSARPDVRNNRHVCLCVRMSRCPDLSRKKRKNSRNSGRKHQETFSPFWNGEIFSICVSACPDVQNYQFSARNDAEKSVCVSALSGCLIFRRKMTDNPTKNL